MRPPTAAALRTVPRLSHDEVAAVHALVHDAAAHDGVVPLSEHVLLHLPGGGDVAARHVLAEDPDGDADRSGGEVVGYAHLDVTDPVAGPSGDVLVHPQARQRGTGRRLVEELLRLSPDGSLRLWAHGEHPAAEALARSAGFAPSRVLWQMRRSLAAPLPPYALPDGVRLRAFVVGQDEQEWTALNARAFAGHPEQGRWGVEEVLLREQEPWFDPSGFLLAERTGADGRPRLVGFHWTKVHGGDVSGGHAGHAHPPVGEVYVVGVDPAEQGRGLGPALTLAGLHSLAERGLDDVLLYVDESNHAAVRVYERLGFVRTATDVCWSR